MFPNFISELRVYCEIFVWFRETQSTKELRHSSMELLSDWFRVKSNSKFLLFVYIDFQSQTSIGLFTTEVAINN